MKSIVSFLVALTFVGVAFAQEESPSPSGEEKPSATVEETAPEATVAPAPKPAAAAKETTTTATTAAKKEASPAAASAKKATAAAPAAAAKPTKAMSVREMEDAWEAAVGKHDFASVEGFVATDFTGVSSKGKFQNRSQMLSDFKGDKDTYKSTKNDKLNVQSFGPNVTVVTGRAREVGTGKDVKAFDRTFLFTDTWVARGGKWQCVASQVSKIKG